MTVRVVTDSVFKNDKWTFSEIEKYRVYMELEINIEKTKQIDASKELFDFLGFTFQYDRGIYGNLYVSA